MIRELRIRDLGVIDEATLELVEGLTVVTGETGAGKTMVVTSLGLLLGERADPAAVRRGAERARAEGVLADLPASVRAAVHEAGGEIEDGELVVARQLGQGRSRSFLGGAGVPATTLAEVIGGMVTVHGQSEQVRLAASSRQREVLDRSAGAKLRTVLTGYRQCWEERNRVRAELTALRSSARERARQIDLLRFGLGEIEAVDPQPEEDTQLAAEAGRLQAVDDLRSGVDQALVALAGSEDTIDQGSALTAASTAQQALRQVADRDAELAPLAERAAELSVLASDLAQELAGYLAGLEADPNRLEWIAERRAALQGLTRKYGDDVAAVLDWAREAAAELAGLDAGDDRIRELEQRLDALDTQVLDLARQLTGLRQRAADKLARAVRVELKALAMPHARLEFTLEPLSEPGAWGGEQVVLQFSANPGSDLRPLGKVASGGELSRVRLALEVVLAGAAEPGTFVFDEVDAGVGGVVAVEIGRRLARLAEHHQVVVVTHLAQVAAFAERHLVVHKASDGQVTTSGVRALDADEREAELARMMAGLETTDTARAHARELLAEARGRHGADNRSGIG